LVRKKLPLTHCFSLEIHIKGTERRAQIRPHPLVNILTKGAMDRTSGQTQAKLILLHSISSKIPLQEKGGMKGQQAYIWIRQQNRR
jgi:hypothetical protein